MNNFLLKWITNSALCILYLNACSPVNTMPQTPSSTKTTIYDKETAIEQDIIENECQLGIETKQEIGTGAVERIFLLSCQEALTYKLHVTITRFVNSDYASQAFQEIRNDLPVTCFHGYPSKYDYRKNPGAPQEYYVTSEYYWQADRWLIAITDSNDTFVHSQDVAEKVYRYALINDLIMAKECVETPISEEERLPNGEYICQGHENGLVASIGSVIFNLDRSFIDKAFYGPFSTEINGFWQYNSNVQQILFSDNIDFQYGVYDDLVDIVTLYLRDGITRAHADGGIISCFISTQ